jgi:predicted kinase
MKKFAINTLKSPFVILLVGPPLVGKSTAIKSWLENYNGEVTIISRDAIVLEQYGSDDYSAAFNSVNQKQVDKILVSRLEDANMNKDNVIIDMTNLTTKRRSYNLSFFDEDYYKVAVIFPFLEWNEFVSRNEKRKIEENKFIPEYVIKNMMGSFSPIKDSEDFDKVISL